MKPPGSSGRTLPACRLRRPGRAGSAIPRLRRPPWRCDRGPSGRRARHRPCPSGSTWLRSMVSGSGSFDFASGARGARDRDRSCHPVGRAVPLVAPCSAVHRVPSGAGDCSKSRAAASSRAAEHFHAPAPSRKEACHGGRSRPAFVPVGTNPARLFGLGAEERACRLADNLGFRMRRTPLPGTAGRFSPIWTSPGIPHG
jgi:hypothetical protein